MVDFDPNGQSGQHLSGQSGQLTQWSDQWGQHASGQSGQHMSGQSGQLSQWSDQWGQHVSGQSGQHMSGQSGQLFQTEDSAGLGLKKAPGLDLNTCSLKIDHMLDIHSTSSKNPTLYTWCLP